MHRSGGWAASRWRRVAGSAEPGLTAPRGAHVVFGRADVPNVGFAASAHVLRLGVKGLVEAAMTGVAAAIANAVFDATGLRIRSLPIRPDKLG